MKHARKILILTAAASISLIFIIPLLVAPTDAYSILDTTNAKGANIGDAFYIDSRGGGAARDCNENHVRVLIKMHIEFTLVRRGLRGVIFEITSGTFTMNLTQLSFSEGMGFAGRPKDSRFNGTVIFGFKFNMTDLDGKMAEVGLIGKVKRTEEYGPVLVMKGRINYDGLTYGFIQAGKIHRITE
jgi:hypothetical protein